MIKLHSDVYLLPHPTMAIAGRAIDLAGSRSATYPVRPVTRSERARIRNQATAEALAAELGDEYGARRVQGQWVVWCWPSDHACEFDDATIEAANAGNTMDAEPLN